MNKKLLFLPIMLMCTIFDIVAASASSSDTNTPGASHTKSEFTIAAFLYNSSIDPTKVHHNDPILFPEESGHSTYHHDSEEDYNEYIKYVRHVCNYTKVVTCTLFSETITNKEQFDDFFIRFIINRMINKRIHKKPHLPEWSCYNGEEPSGHNMMEYISTDNVLKQTSQCHELKTWLKLFKEKQAKGGASSEETDFEDEIKNMFENHIYYTNQERKEMQTRIALISKAIKSLQTQHPSNEQYAGLEYHSEDDDL